MLNLAEISPSKGHGEARASYAKLIRRRLSSGHYEVVTGVFTTRGSKIASQTWDAAELDQQLTRKFRSSNVITITA